MPLSYDQLKKGTLQDFQTNDEYRNTFNNIYGGGSSNAAQLLDLYGSGNRSFESDKSNVLSKVGFSNQFRSDVDAYGNWNNPQNPADQKAAMMRRTSALEDLTGTAKRFGDYGLDFTTHPEYQSYVNRLGGLGATATGGDTSQMDVANTMAKAAGLPPTGVQGGNVNVTGGAQTSQSPVFGPGTTQNTAQNGGVTGGLPGSSPVGGTANYPTQNLQPGMTGDSVKQLQQFLVSKGYLTQDQMNTGPGIYGPQTTAAVAALQKAMGIDTQGNPGYFGPITQKALAGQVGTNTTGNGGVAGGAGGSPTGGTGGTTGTTGTGGSTGTTGTTTPTNPVDQALADWIKASQTQNTEDQKALDAIIAKQANVTAANKLGSINAEGQPVAQSFISGQQAAMAKQAQGDIEALGAQAVPLQQKLALAQSQKQAAADVASKRLDVALTREKNTGDANKLDTSVVNAGGRQLLINSKTGQTIKDLGASASTLSGGENGLTQGQIQTALSQIAGQFDNEPAVRQYQTVAEGAAFAKSLSNNTTNPTDDQGLIYAFAKAMDPGSVVREGEYATVQKYSQSLINSYGKGVSQAINGTGFLTADARANIKKTILAKEAAAKASYDNIYKSYQKKLDDVRKGTATAGLVDYSQAYGGGNMGAGSPSKFDYLAPQITIKGQNSYLPRSVWASLSGGDKDALLAEAKADGYPLLIE